jgi:SP family sugar:H+ symporter-like MFS transporter
VLTPLIFISLYTGYDTGQISQILLFEDFIDRFGQTNAQGEKEFESIVSSLLVSLMSIGTLFGALIGSFFLDRWGRRKTLTFAVFWFIIGNIIQITGTVTLERHDWLPHH